MITIEYKDFGYAFFVLHYQLNEIIYQFYKN